MSPNPWFGRETELQRSCTQSFINTFETQTQQQPSFQEDPDATEQRVQPASHHVSIDTTTQVRHFTEDSRCHCTQSHDRNDSDSAVYASFNLLNITAPILLYLLNGRTMTTFWENTRNFIILAKEYLIALWLMLQMGK